MWPFASRGSREKTIAPEPRDLPPFDEFAKNDVSIKIWLSVGLSDRLNWLSKQSDQSRPDVIRELLFEHIFGRVGLTALLNHVRMNDTEETLASARKRAVLGDWQAPSISNVRLSANTSDSGKISYSKRDVTDEDLRFVGKATDDFTLQLPARLKQELKSIAKMHGLTPSSYVRKMLVQQLFGEARHTEWQMAIGKLPKDIELLERE